MMNKNLILVTVLCLGYLSQAGDKVKVDYMKLTKKNLPNIQQLVQGALCATGVYLDSAQMKRDIRKSAIYPDMTIGVIIILKDCLGMDSSHINQVKVKILMHFRQKMLLSISKLDMDLGMSGHLPSSGI